MDTDYIAIRLEYKYILLPREKALQFIDLIFGAEYYEIGYGDDLDKISKAKDDLTIRHISKEEYQRIKCTEVLLDG